MTDWFKIIPELLKLTPGLMFPIAIATYLLLFKPGLLLSPGAVQTYVDPYRVPMFIAWITSSFVTFWYGIRPSVREWWKSKGEQSEALQRQMAETEASKIRIRRTLLTLHVIQQRAFMSVRNAPNGVCWFPRWHSDLDRLLGLELVSKVVREHGTNSDSAVEIEPKLARILEAYPELLDGLSTEKHPDVRYDGPGPERQSFI